MTADALRNSVGLAPNDWGPPARHAARNTPERSIGRSVVRAVEPRELGGVAVPGALTAPVAVAKNPIFVRLPRSAHKWRAVNCAAPFEGSFPMEDCRHEEVAI